MILTKELPVITDERFRTVGNNQEWKEEKWREKEH